MTASVITNQADILRLNAISSRIRADSDVFGQHYAVINDQEIEFEVGFQIEWAKEIDYDRTYGMTPTWWQATCRIVGGWGFDDDGRLIIGNRDELADLGASVDKWEADQDAHETWERNHNSWGEVE